MRVFRPFAIVALALSALPGCAVIDPFKYSDEALMASVALEVPLGESIDTWLKETTGKKVVLVNMENASHTDDQAPEYLLHDALVARLVSGQAQVSVLERDPDLLALIGNERADGVKYTVTTAAEPGTTLAERRVAVGKVLREVVDALDDQNSLVVTPQFPEKDNAIRGGKALETIVSNEVGPTKAALLRELVGQYSDLYKVTQTEKREVSASVSGADYLFAYRIYDFGTWSVKDTRFTYLKAHVRIVDMQTGEVVVSNFIEQRVKDKLNRSERATLSNTHAKQSDYGRPAKRTSDTGTGPGGGAGPGNSGTEDGGGGIFGWLLGKR